MAKGADTFSPNTVVPTSGDRKLAKEIVRLLLEKFEACEGGDFPERLMEDTVTTLIARHAMTGLAKPSTPKQDAAGRDAGRKLYKALEASAEEGHFTDMTGPEDAILDGHFDLVKAARLFGERA